MPIKTMCRGCMKISDTKLCMACQTKAYKDRNRRPRYQTIWHTPAWRMTRERVLRRDGYACRKCGAQPPQAVLEAHHLHYDAPFDSESCVTLCRQCHGQHRNRN